jgi:hypothetical protein
MEEAHSMKLETRLVEPAFQPKHIRTSRSLISLLVGEGTRIEMYLFRAGAKNVHAMQVLWILWVLGAGTGVLVLSACIPLHCIWACLLMLPLPLIVFCILSADIVELVIKEFEYKLLTFFQILMVIAVCTGLGDRRCLWWLCYAPAKSVALLIDAYPAKYSVLFSRLFFISQAIVLLSWDTLVISGWCQVTKAKVGIGQIAIGAVPFSCTTSLTMLCFCYRHLKVAFYAPENLVLLKSALQTHYVAVDVTENGEEVSVVRSMSTRFTLSRKDTDAIKKRMSKHQSKLTLLGVEDGEASDTDHPFVRPAASD